MPMVLFLFVNTKHQLDQRSRLPRRQIYALYLFMIYTLAHEFAHHIAMRSLTP